MRQADLHGFAVHFHSTLGIFALLLSWLLLNPSLFPLFFSSFFFSTPDYSEKSDMHFLSVAVTLLQK